MRTTSPIFSGGNSHNRSKQSTKRTSSPLFFNPTTERELPRPPSKTHWNRGESGGSPVVVSSVKDLTATETGNSKHRRRRNRHRHEEKGTSPETLAVTPKQRQLHKLSEAAALAVTNSVKAESPQIQSSRQIQPHQQEVPSNWFAQSCLYNTKIPTRPPATKPTATTPEATTQRIVVEEYRQPTNFSNTNPYARRREDLGEPKQPLVSALRKGNFGNNNKYQYPETNSIVASVVTNSIDGGHLVTPTTSNTADFRQRQHQQLQHPTARSPRRKDQETDIVELRRQQGGYRYEKEIYEVVEEEDPVDFDFDSESFLPRKYDESITSGKQEEIIVLDDIVYDSQHHRYHYNYINEDQDHNRHEDEDTNKNVNGRTIQSLLEEQVPPQATPIEQRLLQLELQGVEEQREPHQQGPEEEDIPRTALKGTRRRKQEKTKKHSKHRNSHRRNHKKKNPEETNKKKSLDTLATTAEDDNYSCGSSCASLVGPTSPQEEQEELRRLLQVSPTRKATTTVTVDPIGGVVGQVRTQQPQYTTRLQQQQHQHHLARRQTRSIYDTLHCVEPINHKSYSRDILLLQASHSSIPMIMDDNDNNSDVDGLPATHGQEEDDGLQQLEPLPLQELGPLEGQFLNENPTSSGGTSSSAGGGDNGERTQPSSGMAMATTNVEVQYAGSSFMGVSKNSRSADSSSGIMQSSSTSTSGKSGADADDESDRQIRSDTTKRRIKQEEIDQLRNRVDTVLHQLVRGSSDDPERFQMRQGPSLLFSKGSFNTTSTGLTGAGGALGGNNGEIGDPYNPIMVPSTLSALDSVGREDIDRATSLSNYSQRKYAILQELESATSMISKTGTATAVGDDKNGTKDNNGITKTTTANKTADGQKTWIVDKYGDQGEYQGEFLLQTVVKKKNKKADGGDSSIVKIPHGMGTMFYSDGRVYSGEWDQGTWHGEGRAVFANGDIFEGTYHHDQRHGPGCYWWKDGRIYDGGFRFDQRDGLGEYTWPDGAHYKGSFHKGLRHGEGRYVFQDGSVYTGEWLRGKYHGVGEVGSLPNMTFVWLPLIQ